MIIEALDVIAEFTWSFCLYSESNFFYLITIQFATVDTFEDVSSMEGEEPVTKGHRGCC